MSTYTDACFTWMSQLSNFYAIYALPQLYYIPQSRPIAYCEPQLCVQQPERTHNKPDKGCTTEALPEGSARKTKWSREEDEELKKHVGQVGLHNWAFAAKNLNQLFYENRVVRQGKHCRERWFNHLDPKLNSNFYTEGDWTEAEDLKLMKLQAKHGNCWSKVAKKLEGRNDNSVKNRFKSLIKAARTKYMMPSHSQAAVRERLMLSMRDVGSIEQ